MAADEYNDNPNLRRSISMPVKPRHLVKKKLQRSEEMEVVCDSTDYYPESPRFERRPDEKAVMEEDTRHTLVAHSQSFNNFSPNWIGSTIELNSDLHVAGGAAIDYSRKRPYRVIERNGRENVNFRRIPEKSWRYLRDFVTTLVRPLLRFLPQRYITQPPRGPHATAAPPDGSKDLDIKTEHATETLNSHENPISNKVTFSL